MINRKQRKGAYAIGTGVKGKYALLWHQVMHDGKDALLHLTCILGTKDDHLTGMEVEDYTGFTGHTCGILVGWELACIEDGEVRLAIRLKLLLSGSYQHIVHEQCYTTSYKCILRPTIRCMYHDKHEHK